MGGVVGARGVYVLSHLESIHSLGDVLRSWQGGNVFYGCILGGLTGSIFYWFRRPVSVLGDDRRGRPAVAIGIAHRADRLFLERLLLRCGLWIPLGCSLPGRSHAWARQVNAGLISSSASYSLPVHPTQIYASLAGFALLGLLLAYYPRRRTAGQVMAVLMIVYPLTRWPLEALRGDEPAIFAGMTLSQNISLGVFVCGLAVWFGLRGRSQVTAGMDVCRGRLNGLSVSVLIAGVGPGTGTRTSRRSGRIGVKRRSVEKIPRAQVKAAPHEQAPSLPRRRRPAKSVGPS